MRKVLKVVVICCALPFCQLSARILNVPADYPTIQSAINISNYTDTILVQPGVYHTSIYFHNHNVLVASLYLTTDDTSYISSTIIDADTMGVGVSFISGEHSGATLMGFTVRRGNGNLGGGILCDNSSDPTITRNIITLNRADHGAGICCYDQSNPTISDNTISRNRAYYMGGGIFADHSSAPTITSNIITGNYASDNGGGICCPWEVSPTIIGNIITYDTSASWGGGIYCNYRSSPDITNNTIKRNRAARGGGGIAFIRESRPEIINNTIDSNTTPAYGGGIYGDYYTQIKHNSVTGNRAARGGGLAIVHEWADPIIDSNTVAYNSATVVGGGFYCGERASPKIRYNEIRNNTAPDGGGFYCDTSAAMIEFNIIAENVVIYNNGSGVTCHISNDTISYNTISNNSIGDGILLELDADAVIKNNVIEGHRFYGIYVHDSCNPTISFNTIRGNLGGGIICGGPLTIVNGNIVYGNTGNHGGGIHANGSVQFDNNIIYGNTASHGGGFYIEGSRSLLRNNVTFGNSAQLGGGIYCLNDNSTITNSICWADTAPTEIFLDNSSTTVTYSDIQGGWEGIGNFDIDPLLRDPGRADFHLQSIQCGDGADSPCIDTGDHAFLDSILACNWGLGTLSCDIGAYGAGARQGRIIHVPDDISTIQSAIESSLENDTVLVDPGVYYGRIDFDGHNITVGSLFLTTGDESYIPQTVINASDTAVVVTFHNHEDSTAVLKGFTIQRGHSYMGGGIRCDNASPTITRNVISNNTSGDGGAGIFCWNSQAIINSNLIKGNVETGSWGGGGICCLSSPARISNNIIYSNKADRYGGGVSLFWSAVLMINNVVSGNMAQQGGGLYYESGDFTVTNTIFWGDSASQEGDEIFRYYGNGTITYCDIQGGWSGDGNIDIDPLFRRQEGGQFHLMSTECGDSANSPCIDTGNPDIMDDVLDCNNGLGTVLSDMGAYGGSNEAWPTDVNDDMDRSSPLPQLMALSQNYPNPFNASTVICYQLSSEADVLMEVFDLLGRKVKTLVDGRQQAGWNQAVWNADNNSSGVYFYRIVCGGVIESKRMLLLR